MCVVIYQSQKKDNRRIKQGVEWNLDTLHQRANVWLVSGGDVRCSNYERNTKLHACIFSTRQLVPSVGKLRNRDHNPYLYMALMDVFPFQKFYLTSLIVYKLFCKIFANFLLFGIHMPTLKCLNELLKLYRNRLLNIRTNICILRKKKQ